MTGLGSFTNAYGANAYGGNTYGTIPYRNFSAMNWNPWIAATSGWGGRERALENMSNQPSWPDFSSDNGPSWPGFSGDNGYGYGLAQADILDYKPPGIWDTNSVAGSIARSIAGPITTRNHNINNLDIRGYAMVGDGGPPAEGLRTATAKIDPVNATNDEADRQLAALANAYNRESSSTVTDTAKWQSPPFDPGFPTTTQTGSTFGGEARPLSVIPPVIVANNGNVADRFAPGTDMTGKTPSLG